VRTVIAWIVTLLIFFPLGWLVLTASNGVAGDIGAPVLFFTPTLDNS